MSGIHGPAHEGAHVLSAQDLVFGYTSDTTVLNGLSLEVRSGEFMAILGVNGSGKSTLLACMDAVLKPASGIVSFDGDDIVGMDRLERARHIGLVEQKAQATRLTVYDALLLGRHPHLSGPPGEDEFAIVDEVLDEIGMADMALRYVDELSGGEFQKVMLGRAFVQQTDVLLLDEPTNNLDPLNQHEMMHLVHHMVHDHGLAAAAVMHDVNLALRYCNRFCLMKDGAVDSVGSSEIITGESMERIYGLPARVVEVDGRNVVVFR